MDPGRRWLSISKGSKFIHSHSKARGIRVQMVDQEDPHGIPKASEDVTVATPNRKEGTIMVFRSEKVNSHIEYRWYLIRAVGSEGILQYEPRL